MGGLHEERSGTSGRVVENEAEGWRIGDGWWRRHETGSVTKKKGKQYLTTGIGASLTRTSERKRRATTITTTTCQLH